MAVEMELSETARLLLLASLLAKDGLISHNGKGFLKDMILRRDAELLKTFAGFGSSTSFLEELHGLIDRESRGLFDSLFAGLSLSEGKSLSKAERRRKGLMNDRALIYGEVDFASFATILREVAAMRGSKPGGFFYDLGSGTGKAVYVARLTQDYTHCVGIEILRPLHSAAQLVTNRYNAHVKGLLDRGRQQNAAVFVGSFLEYDWSDGDCVFANSTCFPEELMDALARQAEELKPGAILVTFTKGLDSSVFEVLSKRRFDMSWGPATVFIHRRCEGSGHPSPNRAPSQPASLALATSTNGSNSNGSSSSSDIGSESSGGGGGSSSSSSDPTINPDGSVGNSGVTAAGLSGGSGGGGSGGHGGSIVRGRGTEGAADDSTQNGEGGAEAAGEGLEKAGEGSDDVDGDDDEDGTDDSNEKEGEEDGASDAERGYTFDTEQLRDGTAAGDNDNNVPSRANPERFMVFGQLLREAEQAQAQTMKQLNLSREELLNMPEELARTVSAGDNHGGCGADEEAEQENEDEEELDGLHDLSDEGAGGATQGDGPASVWEQRHDPADLGKGARRDGRGEVAGRTQHMGSTGKGTSVPVAGGDAAAVGATAGNDTETEPELGSPIEQHEMESSAATASETNNDRAEKQQLHDGQEQRCAVQNKEAAATVVSTEGTALGTDAAELVVDEGNDGADASGHLLDCGGGGGGGGADEEGGRGDEDGTANGGKGTGNAEETRSNKTGPDGNPDEAAEAFRSTPGDVSAGSPPPSPFAGNNVAGARTANEGAAAAMQCQWLSIKLPPPVLSTAGGRALPEAIDPPGVGPGPPPVPEMEALESPQDAALLKRKSDRGPCGK